MTTGIVIGIAAAAVVAGVLGFFVGRSTGRSAGAESGRSEAAGRLQAAAEALAAGGLPQGPDGSPEAELARALRRGWTPRDEERQKALQEALRQVAGFLNRSIRATLAGAGDDAGADELRERIERALGGIQDLEFFLTEPGRELQGTDLGRAAQQVAREFASDQDVLVRMTLSEHPVRAEVNADAFMDALYLILHNAGRFGGDGAVEVTVVEEDGRSVIRVRDRGEGFTEEAFERAFDPFYSTTDDGLGLGLPHARKVIEGMDGRIELRNVPDGGAEVEISFT